MSTTSNIKEKCGVFGIVSKKNKEVFNQIYLGLYSQQHRGQESAGISTVSKSEKITLHKSMGLVTEVFRNISLEGSSGIGHVRYSTTGQSKLENAQPLLINYVKGSFSIGHNGNLINYKDVLANLERKGYVFSTTTDTEIIAHLIAQEHVKTGNFVEGVKNAMNVLEGAYSLTILRDNGEVIGIRDPSGFRPLVLGSIDSGESYIISSESCGLDTIGAKLIRDIKPGEIVILNKEEGIKSVLGKKGKISPCMFEYIYFARSDSIMNGIPIYDVRKRLGENLYYEEPTKADLVTAVPDSGITSAIGYSHASKIPYGESLIKNRYIGRTFIMPEQSSRELAVQLKLNPIVSEVKGKDIILVDDSIVRGTTMKNLVSLLRKAGAKKVHVRISCPPLKCPCHYGIDMKTHEEFVAAKKTVEEIKEHIGADTLKYNSLEGLVKTIGFSEDTLCLACLNGKYPIKEKQSKLKT